MIYTDEQDIVNLEYGYGSIIGFITEKSDGAPGYSIVSTDKHEIGAICENYRENLAGKDDTEAGISVRFIFHNIKSLDILIEDLQDIRKDMQEKLDMV